LIIDLTSTLLYLISITGDNDVYNQPSLLSDLDSLTEPSLESLTNLQQISSSRLSNLTSNENLNTVTSISAIEDEMLLLRLIDIQRGYNGGASGNSCVNSVRSIPSKGPTQG